MPRRLEVGRRTRVTFVARVGRAPAPGVVVRLRGRLARTSAAGLVRMTVRLRRPGRYRARGTRADLRPATITLRAVPAPASCSATSC
jgi:hypothetical protein